MTEHELTVNFQVHDERQSRFADILITDVVQASFTGGKWTISATVGDFLFVGEPAEYKNQAVLNFLKARLGLAGEPPKEGM